MPVSERLATLSYFFPAHNEEANLEGLVEEALATLPTLADTFEIVIVDDGSRDATGRMADALAVAHPGVVRPSTTRRTSATARPSDPASARPATIMSPSPTGTASSGSPTSGA